MAIYQTSLQFQSAGQGLREITDEVRQALAQSGFSTGLVNVFCLHTSCSLVIMENADPTARADLHRWLSQLVPDDNPHFEHTLEGPDDMPSHIKMALTRTSETIPITKGRLALGTWQGIFLWEHRDAPHQRQILVSIMGE